MTKPNSLLRPRREAERAAHAARVEAFLARRPDGVAMAQLVDEFSARVGAAKDVHNLIAWMLRHDRIDYEEGPNRAAGVYRVRPAEEAKCIEWWVCSICGSEYEEGTYDCPLCREGGCVGPAHAERPAEEVKAS